MSDSYVMNSREPKVHVQGPNWTISARHFTFESADALRQTIMQTGAAAKVQKMSNGTFLVKTRGSKNDAVAQDVAPPIVEMQQSDVKKVNPKREERKIAAERSKRKNG